MPSIVDQRLHAAFEIKEHEALLRAEGVADSVEALLFRHMRDALRAAKDEMSRFRQFEIADALRTMLPDAIREMDRQFRRLSWWSYQETVQILSRQIPRRWFRRVLPEAVFVGEDYRIDLPPSSAFAIADTEPVAGKRMKDSEWREFLKRHIFPPPSRERIERVVYAPISGQAWQERMGELSRKIIDPDRLAGMLVTGASQGMTQAELTRQIRPLVQNIASSAKRIARTEGLRIANQTQRTQYAELGDMLAGVQIVATLDENTRPHHAARNGRIYWTDSRKKPHISELPDLPDEPNCRCYDVPVLHPPEEFENDPQLRAEFFNADNQAIPDPRVYSQWFSQVDPGRRKMSVGAKRYRAVEKKLGRTPEFADFIGRDGKLLTLDHLKRETERQRERRLREVSQLMLQRQELLTKVSRFGFVSDKDSPGIPSPDSTTAFVRGPFFRGNTKPVSDALNLSGTRTETATCKLALDAISDVHGDGELPNIPVKWSKSGSWNGRYVSGEMPNGDHVPFHIQVSKNSPHPHMTTLHEVGHFLDQQGIGSRKFATTDSKFSQLFDAFNNAIANSDSLKELQRLSGLKLKKKTLEHLAYLQKPEELFARSYAQWIASRSNLDRIKKELDASLPKDDTIPYQWSHEDFRPIASALDAIFQELGWLK